VFLSTRLASILKVAAGVLVVVLAVLLAAAFYLHRLSATLPDISSGGESLQTARTSIVYAADGSVLAEWHGEEDRTVVGLESIPQHTRDAVVAIEDERFYQHNGVDLAAIYRAFRSSAEDRRSARGGSTITQQLVKVLGTDGERTLTQRIREAVLAYDLESRADKDQVLETYLNTVYFGHGAYGIESAAHRFFGKKASQLELAESALLAGLIHSPADYSPLEHPQAAQERRDAVVRAMSEQGYVTSAQERTVVETSVTVSPPKQDGGRAPYFVEYVRQTLVERLGAQAVYGGGLRVYTTLEPELQELAEEAVTRHLGLAGDPETALVAVDHQTGGVVAMVGGRAFEENQFNLAVQARRQPGSAFKPFVLVAALEQGVRPEQEFSASPYTVPISDGTWRVTNYENEFHDETLTLRAATTWSVNAVYARLVMQVGPHNVVETARKMGIDTPLDANPAIALGGLAHGVTPLEMASAYGTLASGGVRAHPTGILRVSTDSGETLFENRPRTERVLPESTAMQASLMLHDVVERGTGSAAKIPDTWVAGKTGTTQEYRDAWFVGYAEDLSCAVWVGYREGQIEMVDVHGIKVAGGTYPARIWQYFMRGAVAHRRAPVTPGVGDGEGPDASAASSSAVLVSVCPDSMQLANKRCPAPVEMYLEPSLVPEQTCARH